MALPFLFRRRSQAIARGVHRETVGDQATAGRIAAHPVAGLAGIGGDQRIVPVGRGIFQTDRQQFQFAGRLFQARIDDPGAIAV